MQGNQLLWSAAWLVCFRQFKVQAISPRPFGIGDRLIKAPTTQKFAAIPTNCRQLQWIISAAYSSPLFLFFQKLTFLEKYCGRPEGRDSVCMCVYVCVCVCVCLSVCLSSGVCTSVSMSPITLKFCGNMSLRAMYRILRTDVGQVKGQGH